MYIHLANLSVVREIILEVICAQLTNLLQITYYLVNTKLSILLQYKCIKDKKSLLK